jgi:hypothetical protein
LAAISSATRGTSRRTANSSWLQNSREVSMVVFSSHLLLFIDHFWKAVKFLYCFFFFSKYNYQLNLFGIQ